MGPNLAHSIVRLTIVASDTATTLALSSHQTPSLGRFLSAIVPPLRLSKLRRDYSGSLDRPGVEDYMDSEVKPLNRGLR